MKYKAHYIEPILILWQAVQKSVRIIEKNHFIDSLINNRYHLWDTYRKGGIIAPSGIKKVAINKKNNSFT